MDDAHPESPPLTPRRRGVVAVVHVDARFLVIRRSVHVVAPGALCFPGGGIEVGESESEAVVREFQEELGSPILPIRRIWTSVTRWQVELAWWLCQLDPASQLSPNPAEVESLDWMTRAQMLAAEQLLESNHEFLAALARREIAID